MRTEDLIEQGLPPAAARQEALRRFGDVEKITDACRTLGRKKEREMRRTELVTDFKQDLAFAARQLAKNPGFALIAALTLALGIGATTAIFSVVHAVLLRPLPFPEPDRVVQLWDAWRGVPGDVAPGNFESWRRESRSFERLAAAQYSSFNLTGDDASRAAGGEAASRPTTSPSSAPGPRSAGCSCRRRTGPAGTGWWCSATGCGPGGSAPTPGSSAACCG